jgi:hypothetical protein
LGRRLRRGHYQRARGDPQAAGGRWRRVRPLEPPRRAANAATHRCVFASQPGPG